MTAEAGLEVEQAAAAAVFLEDKEVEKGGDEDKDDESVRDGGEPELNANRDDSIDLYLVVGIDCERMME